MLTKDQIRAVRLKDAELVELPRVGIKVQVVKMAAAQAFAFAELQKKQAKGEAVANALFASLLTGGIVKEGGDPISDSDAAELLEVLSVEELMMLSAKVNAKAAPPVPQTASPTTSDSTSSSSSASPSATGPTPIT